MDGADGLEPIGSVGLTAADTDVRPRPQVHGFRNGPKVHGPAIDAQSRMQAHIDGADDIREDRKGQLPAPGKQRHSLGNAAVHISAIQIQERGVKHLCGDVRQVRVPGQHAGEILGTDKEIHMAAAFRELAIDAILERGCFRDGDKERAVAAKDPADFL